MKKNTLYAALRTGPKELRKTRWNVPCAGMPLPSLMPSIRYGASCKMVPYPEGPVNRGGDDASAQR